MRLLSASWLTTSNQWCLVYALAEQSWREGRMLATACAGSVDWGWGHGLRWEWDPIVLAFPFTKYCNVQIIRDSFSGPRLEVKCVGQRVLRKVTAADGSWITVKALEVRWLRNEIHLYLRPHMWRELYSVHWMCLVISRPAFIDSW